MERAWLALSGLSGAVAVAADAAARHVLADDAARAALVGIAARYALIHAAALLALAALAVLWRGDAGRPRRHAFGVAGWCFALGLVLFPGSLYLLAAGAPPAVARVTPWGGGLFIVGWAALIVAAAIPRHRA
jgi:uncharacterized membrane protein YgdD (TMEM256/DUF423 family)